MKEMKEDTNRWRERSCSWIKSINIVKIIILSKTTNGIFHRTGTTTITITICMETQKIPQSLSNLKGKTKNGAGGINLPDFRLYY